LQSPHSSRHSDIPTRTGPGHPRIRRLCGRIAPPQPAPARQLPHLRQPNATLQHWKETLSGPPVAFQFWASESWTNPVAAVASDRAGFSL